MFFNKSAKVFLCLLSQNANIFAYTQNNLLALTKNRTQFCSIIGMAYSGVRAASPSSFVSLKQNPTPKKKMTKLTDEERAVQLQPLLSAGWSLVNGRDAIHKEYLFGDFNQAFSFMAGVALLAEKTNHHPEWFNVYNKVQVTMSTHDVGGLSAKDIRMATFMEQQAKRFQ